MKVVIRQRQNTKSSTLKLLTEVQQHGGIETCFHCRCALDKTSSDDIIYCKECGLVPSTNSKGNRNDKTACIEARCEAYSNDLKKQDQKDISQVWLRYSKPSDQTEKNFALTLGEVIRIVHALAIKQPLAAQAAEICKQAFEKGLVRGNSLSILAAASVYASARLALVPITTEDIASKSSLPKSDIIHCFRRLQRKLGLTFAPPSLEAHITSILNLISVDPDGELATEAKKIMETAEKNGVTQGRNTAAVAAAIIYAASLQVRQGSELTQRRLAYAANVTETTIRRVRQSLDL